MSTRENLWSFKAFFQQNVSHFRQMIANFGTKFVQFFLIINEKIKEMVNNCKCNLRSSSSIVYPMTINIRLGTNDGIPSNGNVNVVRKEREKVSIIEIDSIPTL